jgi:hypothetical protein
MADTLRNDIQVIRNRAWIEREYGRDKWPILLEQIRNAVAAGERSLSRLVAIIARYECNEPSWRPIMSIACGERVKLPATAAWNGVYAAIAEAVIATCRQDTAAIIELGCGWGRSLFDVWLRGGPCHISYYALELTSAGLDCVRALARLEPAMSVRMAHFDFNEPDFSIIPRPLKHAVVFTVSSLNQVSVLNSHAYRSLLTLAERVDCLHFEEIGWQISPHPAMAAAREYALRNDYNSNLWDVLQALSESRDIELVDVVIDWFGMQPLFPLSLIHWRRLNDRS